MFYKIILLILVAQFALCSQAAKNKNTKNAKKQAVQTHPNIGKAPEETNLNKDFRENPRELFFQWATSAVNFPTISKSIDQSIIQSLPEADRPFFQALAKLIPIMHEMKVLQKNAMLDEKNIPAYWAPLPPVKHQLIANNLSILITKLEEIDQKSQDVKNLVNSLQNKNLNSKDFLDKYELIIFYLMYSKMEFSFKRDEHNWELLFFSLQYLKNASHLAVASALDKYTKNSTGQVNDYEVFGSVLNTFMMKYARLSDYLLLSPHDFSKEFLHSLTPDANNIPTNLIFAHQAFNAKQLQAQIFTKEHFFKKSEIDELMRAINFQMHLNPYGFLGNFFAIVESMNDVNPVYKNILIEQKEKLKKFIGDVALKLSKIFYKGQINSLIRLLSPENLNYSINAKKNLIDFIAPQLKNALDTFGEILSSGIMIPSLLSFYQLMVMNFENLIDYLKEPSFVNSFKETPIFKNAWLKEKENQVKIAKLYIRYFSLMRDDSREDQLFKKEEIENQKVVQYSDIEKIAINNFMEDMYASKETNSKSLSLLMKDLLFVLNDTNLQSFHPGIAQILLVMSITGDHTHKTHFEKALKILKNDTLWGRITLDNPRIHLYLAEVYGLSKLEDKRKALAMYSRLIEAIQKNSVDDLKLVAFRDNEIYRDYCLSIYKELQGEFSLEMKTEIEKILNERIFILFPMNSEILSKLKDFKIFTKQKSTDQKSKKLSLKEQVELIKKIIQKQKVEESKRVKEETNKQVVKVPLQIPIMEIPLSSTRCDESEEVSYKKEAKLREKELDARNERKKKVAKENIANRNDSHPKISKEEEVEMTLSESDLLRLEKIYNHPVMLKVVDGNRNIKYKELSQFLELFSPLEVEDGSHQKNKIINPKTGKENENSLFVLPLFRDSIPDYLFNQLKQKLEEFCPIETTAQDNP